VIEWTTDYVVLASDGRVELVSVKHREEDQPAWSFADLVKENVFRDLHKVWKQTGENGDYVFVSNRGFSRRLRSAVEKAADPGTSEAVKLASVLGVSAEEAARFASRFVLPREPVPDRRYIHDVAVAQMAAVMPQLGLDPQMARACVTALEERVAAIAVDRPLEPEQRIQALAGLMREVRQQGAPSIGDYMLTMDDLREVVAATASGRRVEARVRRPVIDPLFSGRDGELVSLGKMLAPRPDGLVTPAVLTGMPGVGKSALAERFAASRPRATVIAADTRPGLLAGLHLLNPPPEPLASPDGRGYMERSPHPPEPAIPDDPELLLVIDGLSDPSGIAGLVPRASRTAILITTTSPHVDDGFQHLAVGGLSDADAESYLSRVLPTLESDALALLIRAFNGNALGLVQSANYCLATGVTPVQYLERLRRDPVRLLDLGHAVDHPQTIGAAISAGLAQACIEPAARALADALALLAPDPVPEWIFSKPPVLVAREMEADDAADDDDTCHAAEQLAALADPLVLDSAVMSLARHGLVRRVPSGLRMHQLVQEVARTSASPPLRARYAATVGLLLAAMVADDSRPSPDALTPHIAAVIQAADQASADPLVTSYLIRWLGNQHYESGDLATAVSYLRQAADIATQADLPHEALLTILHDLVRVHRSAGATDDALADADRWADAARSAGASLEEYHARFSRIATLAYASRFQQAAAEHAAATSPTAESTDLTVSDQIMELSVLAEIRRGLGDTATALDLVDQASELARDQTTGLRRADHLAALGSQASALERDLGHTQIAVERHREAVIAARELGLRMPLVRQLQGLASRLLDNNDAEEAEQALNEAREIATAESQESQLLGDFLQTEGRIALAREDYGTSSSHLSAAIPLLEAKGEHYRSDLATAWYNLATAQMQLAEAVLAASSYMTARDIEAGIYGNDHPELISTEYSLAVALLTCGDIASADEAVNRCLAIIRRGGQQARDWRHRALKLAIIIDLDARG
jgi:hypothetical protein